MAVQRIQIHNNKKTTSVKHQKREIAALLREGKDEKAKIRTEHIIREDFMIEGLELLELMIELIHERIKQITTSKDPPIDMKEAICSVIWATNNIDITELKEISNQFSKKYGSIFVEDAKNNENNCVNVRLYSKISYKPPSKLLVRKYLEEIAKTYEVDWEPSEEDLLDEDKPFATPAGSSIPMAPGSGLSSAYSRPSAPSMETSASSSSSSSTNSAPVNPAAHIQLNDAERAEYQQFLINQRGMPSNSVSHLVPPPSSSSMPPAGSNSNNSSGKGPGNGNGNSNDDDDGGNDGAAIAYVFHENDSSPHDAHG
jgi:vacuolar protein sorting-associated protein IST1